MKKYSWIIASILIVPIIWIGQANASVKEPELYHFHSINQERESIGLPKIQISDCISKAARIHSYDMAVAGRVYHGLPTDLMQTWCGVPSGTIGDNVVASSSVRGTFEEILINPANKANINNSAWTIAGVGVYEDKYEGLTYVTQFFVDCSGGGTACDRYAQPSSSVPTPDPGPAPLADVIVISPTIGSSVATTAVPLTFDINPNGYEMLLNQDFVLEVSNCAVYYLCSSATVDSPKFQFTSIGETVRVTIPSVPLNFNSRNYLTNFTCAIRALSTGARAPCTSNSYQGSFVDYSGSEVAVHRLWSPILRHHLLTTDDNEIRTIVSPTKPSIWNYEGMAYRVKSISNCVTGQSVYRFYSALLKTHLFTMDENEKSTIISYNNPGVWRYEGVAFCADSSQQIGTRPVYRFYSEVLRSHLYTIDENEKNILIGYNNPGVWRYEGVAYYAYPQ